MSAAYLFQAVNLLVGILMVPVLLRFLDLGQFVLWAIFTTWGGLTLQFENSIQVVSVRRIAREFHDHQLGLLRQAVSTARRAYRVLAIVTMLPVAGLGFLYLAYFATPDLSERWMVEWPIFMAAYGLNYWFGANNAILLATNRVAAYSYISAGTRALSFVCIVWSLSAGYGVLGICLSFAAAVAVNCSLMGFSASRALAATLPTALPAALPASAASRIADGQATGAGDIARYTLFTIAAFALYKLGVLTAASFFPNDVVASYSLTLQAYTMLSSFALVPIQVWLARLVTALLARRQQDVVRELARTLVAANAVFLFGTFLLVIAGEELLALIDAKVSLPPAHALLAVAAAFVIELNLLILINVLVTQQRFGFVKIYVGSVAAGLTCAAVGLATQGSLVLSLIVLPAAIQFMVCLPLIFGLVCAQLGSTPLAVTAMVWRSLVWRR